jgi:hypothetical protein
MIDALDSALQSRGVPLHRVDGVTNPPVFGDARGRLLRRTKIVINFMRQPWDCNMLRFYLSAPNRALMISEPILPHTPVQPGVHLIEARCDQMADTILRYLRDDAARERITDAAYRLVTTELTMSSGISRILDHLPQPAYRACHG